MMQLSLIDLVANSLLLITKNVPQVAHKGVDYDQCIHDILVCTPTK